MTTTIDPLLPDPLPGEPFAEFERWLREAEQAALTPNPNAMCVATMDEHGHPRARIVLCKGVDAARGHVVFFTNYESDKGRQLTAHGWAEAVFHFDAQERQVRLQGPVVRSPAAESDAYFATRPRASQLGAWASNQSRPIASRQALLGQFEEVAARFGDAQVPRPSHWGGWRLWAARVELWMSGDARYHDRAVWTRELRVDGDDAVSAGPWSVTRLQP